jgi:hypothetical protein
MDGQTCNTVSVGPRNSKVNFFRFLIWYSILIVCYEMYQIRRNLLFNRTKVRFLQKNHYIKIFDWCSLMFYLLCNTNLER